MAATTPEEQPGMFSRLANEVLESVEQIVTRMEEGIAAMTQGELPKAPHQPSDTAGDNTPFEMDDLDMDQDMGGSPLEGIASSVIGDIMGGQVGPQTPMEHLQAFRSAIHWKEPFIVSIMLFQVVAFLLCLWASRPSRGLPARITVMVSIFVLVRGAEWCNSYGAQHWEEFATQNYFDQRGIFVGIFLCAPLMLNCFLMLVFYLREASQLLVQVKSTELKRKQEAEKRAAEKRRKKNS